jgi:hypothetical protein
MRMTLGGYSGAIDGLASAGGGAAGSPDVVGEPTG